MFQYIVMFYFRWVLLGLEWEIKQRMRLQVDPH